MPSFSFQRLMTPLVHLLVWSLLGLFLLLWQPLTWRVNLPMVFWVKQSVLFGLLVAAFYVNTYVWVPRFLLKNRGPAFTLINIVIVLLIAISIQRLEIAIDFREQMEQAFKSARETGLTRREDWIDYFSLITALMVFGISTSVKAVQNWQRDRELRQALEREKINSELLFLKAQINPHFFFNTLNNIYALTVIDGDKAREALHRLSRMMRYVLYDTQQSTVRLEQEVAFLKDYVELMQLRLTDKVDVQLRLPSTTSPSILIAPMILLPFVENAFKHGVSTVSASKILIDLQQTDGTVTLYVQNTLFPVKASNLEQSNGIGLANTRRRLDLLYPGRFSLDAGPNSSEQVFEVTLTLTVV